MVHHKNKRGWTKIIMRCKNKDEATYVTEKREKKKEPRFDP